MSKSNRDISLRIKNMYKRYFTPPKSNENLNQSQASSFTPPKEEKDKNTNLSLSSQPNKKNLIIDQPSNFEIKNLVPSSNSSVSLKKVPGNIIEDSELTQDIIANAQYELSDINDSIQVTPKKKEKEDSIKKDISLYEATKTVETKPEIKLSPTKKKQIVFQEITSSLYLFKPACFQQMNINLHKNFEIFSYLITHTPRCSTLEELAIIYTIIEKIKNANTSLLKPTFNGPFLFGSFNSKMNHNNMEIDILFTCKKLNQLFKHNEYIIQNLITSLLVNVLNVESSEQTITHTEKYDKFFVSISLPTTNVRLSVNIFDISVGDNDKCYSYIWRKESKIEDRDINKIILGKLLRMWRRKWHLKFMYPEVLDAIGERLYDGTISGTFVNVLYMLYQKQSCLSKIETNKEDFDILEFYDKKLNDWFTSEKKAKKIQNATRESGNYIEKEKFESVFGVYCHN